MSSAMRPVYLSFENFDVYGKSVDVIYKRGDDLRQDMLMIQMLSLMDNLWKMEGLDCR